MKRSVFRSPLLWLVLLWSAYRVWTLAGMDAYPDPRETLLVEDVLRVRRGQDPTLFHWPGTPWTFLLSALSALFRLDDVGQIVRLARISTLPFGAAALVLLAVIARRVAHVRPAWGPSLLLAISPAFAAGEADIGLVDLPALAWSLLVVTLAARLSVSRLRRRPATIALIVGLFAGFGGAIKLPVLAVVLPAGVLLLRIAPTMRARRLGMAAALFAGIGAGFVIGCPYIFKGLFSSEANPVLAGLRYELLHYEEGHFGLIPTARDTLFSSTVRHFRAFQSAAGGWLAPIVLVGTAAGIVAAAWRRTTRDIAVLGWLFVAVGAIGVHRFSFGRHWLLTLPALYLIALYGVQRVRAGMRPVVWGVLGLAAVHALAVTLTLGAIARRPSTLVESSRWLKEALATTDRALTVSCGPSAPVLTWLAPPVCRDDGIRANVGNADVFVVPSLEATLQRSIAAHPEAYRDSDFFPLSRARFTTGPFYDALMTTTQYREVARFGPRLPEWVGQLLWGGHGPAFPVNALLHPEIRVFARVGVWPERESVATGPAREAL